MVLNISESRDCGRDFENQPSLQPSIVQLMIPLTQPNKSIFFSLLATTVYNGLSYFSFANNNRALLLGGLLKSVIIGKD
jgi:hypothetical protein